jgi:hypothetical protein
MRAWTKDELDRIGAADELELVSERADGTFRRPVTIWVVGVGDELFVRSWRGRGSTWFGGVVDRHRGRISAGGVSKDVVFEEVRDLDAEVDAAYRTKYRRYEERLVEPMVAPQAQAATLKLVPAG